jgi:hypothetical protein
MRLLAIVVLLLGAAACSTPPTDRAAVAPWIVGYAGPPFPYNSPWCP